MVTFLLGTLGCTPSIQESSRVELRFSTWGSAEEMAVLNNLVQKFEAQNPTIKVKILHIPENYFQKLHILIAGNLTPDVMFINSLNFPVYADNNIFMPLQDLLESSPSLSKQTFFEASLEAFTWKDALYALPRDISNLVVYYNQDLFKQAGLMPPSAQWTFDDLVSLGSQLTEDTNGDGHLDQFGFSFFGKPPLLWLPFVWSSGGSLFNENLTAFTLTEPEALEALQLYADLRNKWHIAPTRKEAGSATMSQLFLQGQLAMLVSGRWTVPILRKQASFEWDVVPFPRGPAGSVVGIDASGYAISKASRYPEAAWKLVLFLSSQNAQQLFVKSGLIVPARQDVAQDSDFLLAPPRHGHTFIDIIQEGKPSHTPVRWNEISEELNLALEPVWEGTKTTEEAILQVAPKIEKLLQ